MTTNCSENKVQNLLTGPDRSFSSDARLWAQFTSGNKNAFDIIYDQHFQALCSYGDRICDDKSLVEDVVQNLFIYLWDKKASLGKTNAIKFYLFRCLRRKLIRAITQQQRRPDNLRLSPADGHHFRFTLSAPPSLSSEEKELQIKLNTALDRLTERQQEAIFLRFYNNLSFQEVAEVMDIGVRSVYNLMGRTLSILKAELRNEEAFCVWPTVLLLLICGSTGQLA